MSDTQAPGSKPLSNIEARVLAVLCDGTEMTPQEVAAQCGNPAHWALNVALNMLHKRGLVTRRWWADNVLLYRIAQGSSE